MAAVGYGTDNYFDRPDRLLLGLNGHLTFRVEMTANGQPPDSRVRIWLRPLD